MKRNGHYANGKQRWLCNECRKSFNWKRKTNKHRKERTWFEKWIVEGYSVRQLSNQNDHSPTKLRRIINHWLSCQPKANQDNLERYGHMIFDGTFLHRPVSIVVLMDGATNTIIKGEYDVRENSERQLTSFFMPLKEMGLSPLSFTVDGNPQAAKVLKRLWPNIIIQRCLVHVQRQGLMWCRINPKRTYAKKLRKAFLKVTNIRTKEDKDEFLKLVAEWEEKYGELIESQPERGRVFSDIKRARSMLLKALPNMFHYLENPSIPFTTNALEGYFSRLKRHYRDHRGLAKTKRSNYFNWYFYLKPR